MGKLEQYIDNIEQLGADARFENDREDYLLLETKLQGIIFWAKRAIKTLEEKRKEVENND